MKLVGLTGGIGSGKSTVGRLLAAAGAQVCDVDQLARAVLAPGEPALTAVRRRFGDDVFDSDGTLNRARLAAVVFRDPDALRALESITHPLIAARLAAWIDIQHDTVPVDAVVVVDHPLLIETQQLGDFDAIVVVTCDEAIRRQRLITHRGMSPDDVDARIATQLRDDERIAYATHVIDNSASEATLEREVAELYQLLNVTTVDKPGGPRG